ncbi:hypothetical protein GCM10011610_31300 [Nocardia rhizosphaerihabitans]|uniref:Uncharacterized protein n=1 Tax=Nocardia rhizosphaerihabitans TaxID=1691570 RepID=A0ABQ2KEZ8_9NOCA|nr:hypothetical protein GCM10011610_31300 [Nocardia rhizosphaerihabitans]
MSSISLRSNPSLPILVGAHEPMTDREYLGHPGKGFQALGRRGCGDDTRRCLTVILEEFADTIIATVFAVMVIASTYISSHRRP